MASRKQRKKGVLFRERMNAGPVDVPKDSTRSHKHCIEQEYSVVGEPPAGVRMQKGQRGYIQSNFERTICTFFGCSHPFSQHAQCSGQMDALRLLRFANKPTSVSI